MGKMMTKKNRFNILGILLLLVALALSACGRPQTDVIIAGSTSVQPFAEILEEEYARLYPGKKIDVQGGGTSAGLEAVRNGTANIGMASRELKEAESDLWYVEIAKDGLAVIIHPDNPINDLTLEQVRKIYTQEIVSWDELGGNTAKIHVITREEGSGTRSAFEDLVMNKARITPKAIVQDSNGQVRQLVSSDKNAIGFISLGLIDLAGQKSVKALRLGGIEATPENVLSGVYHLVRPFLFVMKAPPEGIAREFIDFVLSGEGQSILAREGLIPVAEGALR